jgi:hypothetical protein
MECADCGQEIKLTRVGEPTPTPAYDGDGNDKPCYKIDAKRECGCGMRYETMLAERPDVLD